MIVSRNQSDAFGTSEGFWYTLQDHDAFGDQSRIAQHANASISLYPQVCAVAAARKCADAMWVVDLAPSNDAK